MNSQKKLKIIISSVFILLVITIISWLIYYNFFLFAVVSTRPNQNGVSTQAPIIVLKTNRTLVDQPVTFDDSGSGIVSSVNVNGKDIVINLYQNLEVNTDYSITIKNIESDDGRIIESYTYSFTPVNDPSLLNDEDRKIILDRQEQNKPNLMSDPVYIATPFQSDSYIVKSSLNATPDGKGSVSIIATIFLNRSEASPSNRSGAINKYRAQIMERLEKIDGFSKDKYQITFNVQEP